MGFGRGSSTAQKLRSSYFSCGKMLSLGAFATMGAVREPLDGPYTYANFFIEGFIKHGQTLGQAFSYATPWIRWQMILVGDPVMRMPRSPAHWVAPFIPPQELPER